RAFDDQRGADAPRNFERAASSADRSRQRLDRHRGKRFDPSLRSDEKDDEERGQNEEDYGANGANEKIIWQLQSDCEGKERCIDPILKSWSRTNAVRAMENLLRSSGRTIRKRPDKTAPRSLIESNIGSAK